MGEAGPGLIDDKVKTIRGRATDTAAVIRRSTIRISYSVTELPLGACR